jgi:hypothetical protein
LCNWILVQIEYLKHSSGFLNQYNGAEGIHNFGDICTDTFVRQRGEPGQAPVSIIPLKQTNILKTCRWISDPFRPLFFEAAVFSFCGGSYFLQEKLSLIDSTFVLVHMPISGQCTNHIHSFSSTFLFLEWPVLQIKN